MSSSTGSVSATNGAGSSGELGTTKKSNKGAIIGGAVGGVLGLALLIGVVMIFLKRRNAHEPVQEQKAASSSADEVSAPAAGKSEAGVTTSAR
jgi:hypothetical protein